MRIKSIRLLNVIRILFILSIFCIDLPCKAQCLFRTNSMIDFSPASVGTENYDFKFFERLRIDESLFYRTRYNKAGNEKSMYHLLSLYKRFEVIGFCPYGIDYDIFSERFEKNKGNTFRYWNKIRMGFKILFETNPNVPAESPIEYLDGEMYVSYLHLPHGARGDQTTKARKGSFQLFLLATPSQRANAYMKLNVGCVWIKTYYRQEKKDLKEFEYSAGLCTEIEINKKGYNQSIVSSSRDVYRGTTLFIDTEYNIKLSRVFLNLGISITTENH